MGNVPVVRHGPLSNRISLIGRKYIARVFHHINPSHIGSVFINSKLLSFFLILNLWRKIFKNDVVFFSELMIQRPHSHRVTFLVDAASKPKYDIVHNGGDVGSLCDPLSNENTFCFP